MRSLTVVRKGADVVVIYVMEIDVNIVWPMDFVRWIILSIFEDTIFIIIFEIVKHELTL